MNLFKKYLIFLWFYSILVVVWGAWVRISNSGDGCGESWPLCNNLILPDTSNVHTLIEFIHRVSTGTYGVLILVLVLWAFKIFKPKHPVRKITVFVLSLTILEALIGAMLVMFGLVGENTGFSRLTVMSLHQVVSVLLTGSIMRTYYTTKLCTRPSPWVLVIKVLFLLIVATGGITALSNTHFPSNSIIEGFLSDIDRSSHILLRIRVIHPIMAISFFVAILFMLKKLYKNFEYRIYAKHLTLALSIGVLVGILTLITLSPTYMKLVHLVVAHAIWALVVRH